TKDYARWLVQSALLISRPVEFERRVKIRMERQERLAADLSRTLSIVIDEAALLRQVGGAEVMQAQLQLLLACSVRENVTLRVLPNVVGEHPATAGAFTILRFPDEL